ncbi:MULTISPECIES: TetR/AcrR family transcriptional regulator [Bacillus cereus group]|uniref:TetR/AcrR family transcriptional regulator n=1 Tax=Bacillus cereus group TaxID=86661 RepID=UPI001122382C|nr:MULTISPECIES: TetR/AcrR family transcriptional regulator [Bacillus cereus group]MEC2921431.1 TetR/AcrR family transcriptional regulator [Bacillus tropicus]MEC2926540.1 TetR/AcrR family transcriptional regulator [Bacillus tropicus]MEC2956133.1 TetR/AcrR family transcriptional regulator [Bacillus tropicus]MEC3051566.1 TetR/AcrR family transcriptional regulator [Bacillus tropicus]MEC3078001.1 TetR/AcrR family transcriptional regulator [Bacillus tropicus]
MSKEKELRRKTIIAIAAKEFSEKGYDNSNINEIAVMSGIGKGTIYLYFKTKKELYLATMETIVEMFNEKSREILSLNCTSLEKLKICMEFLFKFEEEGRPFLVLWSRYQFQNNPDFQEEVFEMFENLEQPFCDIVKQGVEEGNFDTSYPREVGYLILSMVTMLIPSLQAKPLLEGKEKEEKIDFMISLIKNGLSCKSIN